MFKETHWRRLCYDQPLCCLVLCHKETKYVLQQSCYQRWPTEVYWKMPESGNPWWTQLLTVSKDKSLSPLLFYSKHKSYSKHEKNTKLIKAIYIQSTPHNPGAGCSNNLIKIRTTEFLYILKKSMYSSIVLRISLYVFSK